MPARAFVHLHLHTIYSVLDGAVHLEALMEEIRKWPVPAVAITDHGNLYGVFAFWQTARSAGVKPILGCEFYLTPDRHERSPGTPLYHQVLLAINETGYQNLMKLSSLSFLEGFYGKPRIDHELIERHADGLIATSSCIQGEIPQAILQGKLDEARKLLDWWLERFPGRFYLEIQRHGIPEQDQVNRVLYTWARERGIPLIVTNDVHYLRREDADPHDVLLCIQTRRRRDDPHRLRFQTEEFYLKSPDEMWELFGDLPDALNSTVRIAEQCEEYSLSRDLLLPDYHIPEGFSSPHEYLRHLVQEGARQRYGDPLPEKVKERIDYELSVIERMGFSTYFLIVREIIDMAKGCGARMGPGRGSAVGSIVSYCLGISRIDPLRYNLLFERFLNPERISMPDIDIDFDDEHREIILKKVAEKYGRDRVAKIIAFSSMGPRQTVQDVGRVLDLPYEVAHKISSLIPMEAPQIYMPVGRAMQEVPALRQWAEQDEKVKQCLVYSATIEGAIRQTTVHASGVVIAARPLLELVPLAVDKKGEVITQWKHQWLEEAGLLKMDLLGLANLSIIEEALQLIRKYRGETVDIDAINVDDRNDPRIQKTFELFRKGETIGTFQFESAGMRRYLKLLQPSTFEDIVAMVALYRPGPLEYIPEYIRRKNDPSRIQYKHPDMEPILRDTYGIMVYQEQLMLVAQRLAGFSPAKADTLRKAVGKKQRELLQQLREDFIQGCVQRGISEEMAREIFADIEKFGLYGFNKSHAVAYAFLAFQTAYLKANYPVEYMCALLNKFHRKKKLEEMMPYLNECRRMGIQILPPDVNESEMDFLVAGEKQLRFGLRAIKGLGDAVVQTIIEERQKRGPFRSLFDLTRRVRLNRAQIEALIWSGALDGFGYPRQAYFAPLRGKPETAIEYALKQTPRKNGRSPGNHSAEAGSGMLFVVSEPLQISDPPLGEPEEMLDPMSLLQREREFLGIYVSGHPLDEHFYWLRFLVVNGMRRIVPVSLFRPGTEIDDPRVHQSLQEGWFVAYGVLSHVGSKMSRQKKQVWDLILEDYQGFTSVRVFEGSSYERTAGAVRIGEPIFIVGTVEKRFREDGEEEETVVVRPIQMIPVETILNQSESSHWTATLIIPYDRCTRNLAEELFHWISSRTDEQSASSSENRKGVPERIPLRWKLISSNGSREHRDFVSSRLPDFPFALMKNPDWQDFLRKNGIALRVENQILTHEIQQIRQHIVDLSSSGKGAGTPRTRRRLAMSGRNR